MNVNPDKGNFFTKENLKRLGYTGLFAIALIAPSFLPTPGKVNENQAHAVAVPTPGQVYDKGTPEPKETTVPGTPVFVETPVAVANPTPSSLRKP